MAGPSHLKASHSLNVFSMKSPLSSSTLCSMKLKTLVHTLIFSHLCRFARALSKAKSILVQILKEIQLTIQLIEPLKSNRNKSRNKLFFGSFRLHYNWSSSRVLRGLPPTSHVYHDSTWSSVFPTDCDDDDVAESQLSGYLQWLEEKKVHGDQNSCDDDDDDCKNEIDKLADMFIASCHEKFMLEKQESYRRFQEMMARSV